MQSRNFSVFFVRILALSVSLLSISILSYGQPKNSNLGSSGKKILVFVNDGFIWASNLDGSGKTKFFQGESPRISSSGDMIVYEEIDGGISLIDIKSSGRKILSSEGINPKWSPDGTKILFVSNDWIWCMDTDGENKIRLDKQFFYSALGSSPQWFPDSKHILYAYGNFPNSEIRSMSIDGTESKVICGGGQFALSPDGKWIIFSEMLESEGGKRILALTIYKLNSDGFRRILYEEPVEYEHDCFYRAVWSPAGDEFVVVRAKTIREKENLYKNVHDLLFFQLPKDKNEIFGAKGLYKPTVIFDALKTPLSINNKEALYRVPFHIWGISWSEDKIILAVQEPFASFIPDKEGFSYIGLKGLRPGSGNDAALKGDQLFLITLEEYRSGLDVSYGEGHSPHIQGGQSWDLL